MDLQLRGRRALVTASSKGIGRACAEALAHEGVRVFVSARDEMALKTLNAELDGAGYQVADLAVRSQVEALIEAAVRALGGLDILVVNAGGPPPGTLDEVDDATWEAAFRLTTMSAIWLWRGGVPHLRQSKQGRIVNINSAIVKEPSRLLMLSNALRPGLNAVAKMLSAELAPVGVTVNTIGPLTTLTDRIIAMARISAERNDIGVEEQLKRNAAALPMGRYSDPAEVGALCAYLCSAQAGYITGQTVLIDGGASKFIF